VRAKMTLQGRIYAYEGSFEGSSGIAAARAGD
jgi:hypothetical protein